MFREIANSATRYVIHDVSVARTYTNATGVSDADDPEERVLDPGGRLWSVAFRH
jgi:hypothetical protein